MITFPNIGYLGRLGNQMFQFASTVGIAKKLGYEARFPIENCRSYKPIGPYSSKSGANENVKCDLLEVFEIPNEYFVESKDLIVDYIYNESKFGFNQDVMSLPENCGLFGYFQTEKYFLESRELICSVFSFKDRYKTIALKANEKIRNSNKSSKIASIHVRRGDYLMFPDHHPTCSLEYYDKAIKILSDKEETKFLVFSDDVDWCKTNFKDERFIIIDLKDSYSEMCLMSLCDHNIIANSSFSWWGSWLNQNTDKVTIAPSKWFGRSMNKDTSDVYPDGCIIL